MKTLIKKITIAGVFLIIILAGCNEDFLERAPLDQITDASYWNNSNDLKSFVNGFYQLFPRYRGDNVPGSGNDGSNDGNLDNPSDILAWSNPNGTLMQAQSSGQAPNTDNTWNNSYNWVRQINYFIENSKKVSPRGESVNQYIGEGYFFRAWVYFELLKQYGDIPFIKQSLNVSDKEELYKTRDSRFDVAKEIIADLDSAIVNMNWKGTGSAAEAGRVNKEAAMVMKARVALFEGTWERYHQTQGTPFAVSGKDGTEFLQMIVTTIDQLIDHQGTNIFRDGGQLNEPYNQLFSQPDASKTAGVFLYRVYDASLIGGNSFYEKMFRAPSFTNNLTNAYLDKEGNPQSLSNLPLDNKSLYNQSENLDPRFRQTIWTPDKGPMNKVAPSLGDNPIYLPNSRYPYITLRQHDYFAATGYRGWKGAILDPAEYRNGSTDDVLIRYAEGLLAYAEAKAILGSITQADLDKTVNLLRSRVNMAPMVLGDVNSWPGSIYHKNLGFDSSEPNIVNEIRRERLVELAWEGFRLDDLKRWAVYEDVINGYKPKGAHIEQFLSYYNNTDSLIADGYTESQANLLSLTVGTGFNVDEEGYINPFHLIPEFRADGVGYYIDPNRDYLSPIPKEEIDLYKQKGGVELKQNPGWF
jgi:starch-binding outer membrane protein, SusD/RagB family